MAVASCDLLFKSGRMEDCATELKKILSVQRATPLSLVHKFTIASNILATRPTTTEVGDLLQSIKEYKCLWQRAFGVPVSINSLTTDLVLSCNLIATLLHLWVLSGDGDFALCESVCDTAIERANTIIKLQHQTEIIAQCLQRLSIFKQLLTIKHSPCDVTKLDQLLQDKHSALEEFDATMDTEQQAPVSNLSIEEKYLSALLSARESNLILDQSVERVEYGAIIKLLQANRHIEKKRYQLGLHGYHHCMDSSITLLPAMYNAAMVYQLLGNIDAELAMTKLLIECLKSQESTREAPLVWWKGDSGDVMSTLYRGRCNDVLMLNWLVIACDAAGREMRRRRYGEAAGLLEMVIEEVENGLGLPSSLPSLPHLLLLLVTAWLCNGDQDKAQAVAIKLTDLYSPLSCSVGEEEEAAILSLILWIRAIMSEGDEELLTRCLEAVCCVIDSGMDNDRVVLFYEKMKMMVLNNLGLLAIGRGENDKAFRLLSRALSSQHMLSEFEDVRYNYCLLLGKTGRLMEASKNWLVCKEKLTSRTAAINMLHEEKSCYQKMKREGGCERERLFVLMNTTTLQYWAQHCDH